MYLLCLLLLLWMAHPVPFEQNGRWGYKDAAGKVAIPARYQVANEFSAEGLAAVVDAQGWACIDPSGRVLIRPLVVDNGPDDFREGLARFRQAGRVGFFDRRGRVAIPPAYSFAQPFSDGLAAVCDRCREVPEGEHTALRGGRWGYIDRSGKLAIPLRFERASSFENGHAEVILGGQKQIINRQGEASVPASIGSASMEPDGTIVLQLRAESAGGARGDALLRYPKTHAQYQDVLKHLGGLKPGETKPVPPWPEK